MMRFIHIDDIDNAVLYDPDVDFLWNTFGMVILITKDPHGVKSLKITCWDDKPPQVVDEAVAAAKNFIRTNRAD